MQTSLQEQIEYAGLGWRVAAVVIDTVVLFFLLVVLMGVAAVFGLLELPDPNTSDPFDIQAARATMPTWLYVASYAVLFAYYAVLEGLAGASVGKLALGLRVRMDDGRPATSSAIVLRNLVRIPEAVLWYIPSGISCLVSRQRKRLGDFAAGTVVVRRAAGAQYTVPAAQRSGSSAAPVQPTQPAFPTRSLASDSASPSVATTLGLPEALARLKVAALAARGAHDSFLRFSQIELARQAENVADDEEHYSPEYIAAWYSLSEAVHELNEAHAVAAAASTRADTTLEASLAAQPDLAYLLGRLGPYLTQDAAERLHEAYVAVVRSETRS